MKKYLLIVLLFSNGFILSQQNFRIEADKASFRYDSARAYVEVYYSVYHSNLTLKQVDTAFTGGAVIQIMLKDLKRDSIIQGKAWKIPFVVKDPSEIDSSKSMIGATAFLLKPGEYEIIIIGHDMNNFARYDSFTIPLLIKQVPSDKVWLSDIELCTRIHRSQNKNSMFYKNTLEVVPNPSLTYGIGLPVLYYYAEVYNIKTVKADKYLLEWKIYNSFGQVVKSSRRFKPKVVDAAVEVGAINISKLPMGTYKFTLTVLDTVTRTGVISSKKFFVYNPHIQTADSLMAISADVLYSEYSGMSEEELDKEFRIARYIATTDEQNRYKQLKGAEAKRKFLIEFWRKRDPDLSTPVNEMKREYFRRVEYANKHFSIGKKEGWMTDRGRVYIMYGPPDEYERYPSEGDTKPYEIWYYHNIEGGVEFVFIDKTGFSDYILVHSTKRGEIRDDNWRLQIMPSY
jgi:GWxTD domain-containing protein